MWVNSEKYIFSEHIVQTGQDLSSQFNKLVDLTTKLYFNCIQEINFNNDAIVKAEVSSDLWELEEELIKFDQLWAQYEREYINELMTIETDSRRFITEAISVEANLTTAENEKSKDGVQEGKVELIKLICSVNAIANIEGKGRDDFSLQTLLIAE